MRLLLLFINLCIVFFLSSCANHISSDTKSRIRSIYIEPIAEIRCSFPGGQEHIPKEIRSRIFSREETFNDFLNNAARTLEADLLREKFHFKNELRKTTQEILKSKGYSVVNDPAMADARLKITSVIGLRSTNKYIIDADGVKESVVGAKLATVIELYKTGGNRLLFDQYIDPFDKSPEKFEFMAEWFKNPGLLIDAIKSQLAHQTPVALEKL